MQDDLVCKVEIPDVPFFNAPIYLENKEQIGKIDEIFGNIRDYSVTIRLGDNMRANSFKKNQKVIVLGCKFSQSPINTEPETDQNLRIMHQEFFLSLLIIVENICSPNIAHFEKN